VALANYVRAFSDAKFWNALKVTFLFATTTLSIEMILGLGLALLMNQEVRGKRHFRTILTLPLFVTPVALGYLGITIFFEEGGPLASIFQLLQLPKVNWLSNPRMALFSAAILDIWQWSPFCFLIMLAGLQGIPDDVYEAAALETNSKLKILRYVSLPLIAPVLAIVFVLKLVESFKVYDIVFSLTGGGPGRSTEVYSLLVHRTAMQYFDIGYACTLSYIFLAVMMVAIVLFFKRLRGMYS